MKSVTTGNVHESPTSQQLLNDGVLIVMVLNDVRGSQHSVIF